MLKVYMKEVTLRARELEGMEQTKGFLTEPFDTMVEIVENGVKYIC